ncbi:unnamed protein product, partial [Staurois parvus]
IGCCQSRVSHGSLYGLPLLLVAIATTLPWCHFHFRSPPTAGGFPFCHIGAGRLQASHCCCQARNLPWPPYRLLMLLARSRVCHGSLYGLPLLLSPSPHSAMCHFQVSSHC